MKHLNKQILLKYKELKHAKTNNFVFILDFYWLRACLVCPLKDT